MDFLQGAAQAVLVARSHAMLVLSSQDIRVFHAHSVSMSSMVCVSYALYVNMASTEILHAHLQILGCVNLALQSTRTHNILAVGLTSAAVLISAIWVTPCLEPRVF